MYKLLYIVGFELVNIVIQSKQHRLFRLLDMLEGTLQYYYHATLGEPRVLLGLHGNSTEGFFLKILYCLECIAIWTNPKPMINQVVREYGPTTILNLTLHEMTYNLITTDNLY